MGAEHTATPWTLTHVAGSNFAVQEFEIRGVLGDKPGVWPIFNKDHSAINGTTVFMHPDDAAFIVRACNAHDELVTALHDLLATTLEQMPPFEAGIEAQNDWADRCAKARNDAAFILTKLGAIHDNE